MPTLAILDARLDTALPPRLFSRRHMNLHGSTISSRFAHVSVVAVSVAAAVVVSVVTDAPRGF
jgi:hypothetical protein